MVWDIPQATTPHIEGNWFSLETKNQISVLFKQEVFFDVLVLTLLSPDQKLVHACQYLPVLSGGRSSCHPETL